MLMRNFTFILFGSLLAIVLSWTGLILSSQIQYGDLTPVALEEGDLRQPQNIVGRGEQGKEVYLDLGCIYCHTQQVRRKGYGADYERGWGDRQSVPRDYILQKRVVLGTSRTGPDLANVGVRLTADWHAQHLYDPQITSPGSIMPPFKFLFKKQKIGHTPHPNAIKFPLGYAGAPEAGYEIVPTDRGAALIEYLMSLKFDYELPESKFQ